MPPRSVCLNLFTTTRGEVSAAAREDALLHNRLPAVLERRDSAQGDMVREPTSTSTSSVSAFSSLNRADLFHALRPMASTESLNMALSSKACSSCSVIPARRRCSRCKSAYYCDRNCQKVDWKTHRAACEPVVAGCSASATPNTSTPTSPSNEG